VGVIPIYEYEHDSCGKRFEELVKLVAPTPKCPRCKTSKGVRKIISIPSDPQFKGTGFYSTDYKKVV
jgi:putative FmdB family regulatory protein